MTIPITPEIAARLAQRKAEYTSRRETGRRGQGHDGKQIMTIVCKKCWDNKLRSAAVRGPFKIVNGLYTHTNCPSSR